MSISSHQNFKINSSAETIKDFLAMSCEKCQIKDLQKEDTVQNPSKYSIKEEKIVAHCISWHIMWHRNFNAKSVLGA